MAVETVLREYGGVECDDVHLRFQFYFEFTLPSQALLLQPAIQILSFNLEIFQLSKFDWQLQIDTIKLLQHDEALGNIIDMTDISYLDTSLLLT